METLDAIKTRRSIRKFLKKDVNIKLIRKIIEAGIRAPSAKNTQPWDFVIFKGKKKDAIVNLVEKEFSKRNKIYCERSEQQSSCTQQGSYNFCDSKNCKVLAKQGSYRKSEKTASSTLISSSILVSCALTKNAPVLILIFNKAPYTRGEKNVVKKCDYESLLEWTVEVESVSAAIQNMLLAIHDLGLGGVWLANFNFARKKIYKFLNYKYDLIAGIALGYPAYKIPPKKISKINIKILK